MKNLTIEERRKFFVQAGSLLGITVCASSMAAVLSACEKDESKLVAVHGDYQVNIANEAGLADVGGGVKKTAGNYNGSKPIIIIRTGAASFLVVSSVCNHAGCEVSAPKSKGANMTCDFNDNKCGHNAQFSQTTGLQVVGPNGGSPSGGLSVLSSTYDSGTQTLTVHF